MELNSTVNADLERIDAENGLSGTTRRRALGIYYTPDSAAKGLADWAIQSRQDRVLEPSFGGCSLLNAGVNRLRQLGAERPGAQLHGYDIDPEAFDYLSRLGISSDNFKRTSFLSAPAVDEKFNSIIANPPFVSWQKMTRDQREEVQELRRDRQYQIHGRASLWAYFLIRSMEFLNHQGRMAFILPNSVLTADYAKPIIKSVRSRFRSVQLINVTAHLFANEGTSERTCLLLCDYFNDQPTRLAPLKVQHASQVEDLHAITRKTADQRLKRNSCTANRFAITATRTQLKRPAFQRLGEQFQVSIGEVVGDVKFFVRPAEAWRKLNVPERYLAPILTRAAAISGITIPNKPCAFAAIPQLMRPDSDNLAVPVKQLLESYDVAKRDSNATFNRRDKWFQCSYDTTAVAFMGSICTHAPKIIQNTAQISCSNALYKFRPREPTSSWSRWLAIISLTTPFQLSAEQYARVRGNGGLKLEPSDTLRLAIPARLPKIEDADFHELLGLLDRFIMEGNHHEATQLADEQLLLETGLVPANRLAELRRRTRVLRNLRRIQ